MAHVIQLPPTPQGPPRCAACHSRNPVVVRIGPELRPFYDLLAMFTKLARPNPPSAGPFDLMRCGQCNVLWTAPAES